MRFSLINIFAMLHLLTVQITFIQSDLLTIKRGALSTFQKSLKFRSKIAAAAIIVSVFYAPDGIKAQIPIVSEQYNIGSGSKVIATKVNLRRATGFEDALNLGVENLSTLKDQVVKKDWDGVLSVLQELKVLRSNYFGLGNLEATVDSSLQGLAKYLKISVDRAKEIDEAREQLSFSLGQIGDFAISKRVVYFNSEDLNQINILGEESGIKPGSEDVSEVLDLVNEATVQLRDLMAMIHER